MLSYNLYNKNWLFLCFSDIYDTIFIGLIVFSFISIVSLPFIFLSGDISVEGNYSGLINHIFFNK
jgi:hypothetical protein